MSEPDRMDLHEFRASRRRKTDNLLKEDHRDLKRFFALDSAAYRDATAQGGLDEPTKELLGLVASAVLRCNDCIAYHCDRCVAVGWRKSELLDALNVALVVGGSITIPHLRTVWEVVEQLYEEKEGAERARQGTPALAAAAREVASQVEEHDSEAHATLGLPEAARGRKARQGGPDVAKGGGAQPRAAAPARPARSAAPTRRAPAASPTPAGKAGKPPPTVKADRPGNRKSKAI